jgi:subtilisin
MRQQGVGRRELLRLVGAGILAGTVGAGTASAREGAYIVGTSNRAATRETKRQARAVTHVFDFGPRGQAVAGRFPEAALNGLSRRPDVRYVEADGQYHAIALDATDLEVSRAWGVDRIDAEKAWSTGDGSGAHIAIIDTGIDSNHSDLAGNLAPAGSGNHRAWTSASGYAYDWDDDHGHGTHCAGIAAADHGDGGVAGVACRATLHALKVLSSSGSGSFSNVAAAIEYTADKGWDVASLSLGGGYSWAVEDAVEYATSRGVLVVAAAGNKGPGTADTHYPSALPGVVAVGATESDDDIADFSSTGDTVEVAAPGRTIRSTYPGGGWATMSGTSMACPHVAATGAILMALGKSNTEARSLLATTAEDIGLSAQEAGAGLVDVEAAALAAAGGGGGSEPDTTPPAVPGSLTATDTTAESVNLAWSPVSDADLAHYSVYVDGTLDGPTTSANASVTGLDAETSYDFTVSATDTSGNESAQSAVYTVTTDPAPSGEVGAPTAEVTSVSEYQHRNPHAEFDVTWIASDPDSDIERVVVSLYDDSTGGSLEESVLADTRYGGTTRVKAHKDDGRNHDYTVTVVATDAGGRDSLPATYTFAENNQSR